MGIEIVERPQGLVARVSPLQTAFFYGTMYGLILVAYQLLSHMAGGVPGLITWILYLGLGVLIALGIISYRDKKLNGFIEYSQALGTGTLIGLFCAFVAGIYAYIYYSQI